MFNHRQCPAPRAPLRGFCLRFSCHLQPSAEAATLTEKRNQSPRPGPGCARSGRPPVPPPRRHPCWGLLGPEPATPWAAIPCPTGLWCNQQGSTCPCLDTTEHDAATVTSPPPTQVQGGAVSLCLQACCPGGPRSLVTGPDDVWHLPPRKHTLFHGWEGGVLGQVSKKPTGVGREFWLPVWLMGPEAPPRPRNQDSTSPLAHQVLPPQIPL